MLLLILLPFIFIICLLALSKLSDLLDKEFSITEIGIALILTGLLTPVIVVIVVPIMWMILFIIIVYIIKELIN